MGRIPCVFVLGAWLAAGATPALAQAPRPERPYRGLFGSGAGDAEQSLSASGSFATGWDDDLLAAARGQNSVTLDRNAPEQAGSLGHFSGGLAYSYQREAVAMRASATTSIRYVPSLDEPYMRAMQGNFGLATAPARNTTFSVSASAAHQPYALLSLFPTITGAPAASSDVVEIDASISNNPRLSYAGAVAVTQRLSRRTTASGVYTYQLTERPGSEANFRRQNVSGRLTHQLGTGFSVYGGYGYGEGKADGATRFPNHQIGAGVDYNRALSFTRRTTVSFDTGSTAVRARDRFRFLLTGSARLTHELGRTWTAWTSIGRHLHYHETWRAPGLANGVSFGVNGLVTRRLQANVLARVSTGSVGVEANAPGFDHYAGTASLSYAFARFMSASLSYGFYQHSFDAGAPLADGVPLVLDRNSVRVAVNLWAPIFQRARRTDASR